MSFNMRNIECEGCHENYIEVDETPFEDGSISSVHCILCGHNTQIS
jgi:hypothetical protein